MIPKGSVRGWVSLIAPPDGWDFFPLGMKYMNMVPLPIFATRDVDEEPMIPSEYLDDLVKRLELLPDGVSPQGRLAGKVCP